MEIRTQRWDALIVVRSLLYSLVSHYTQELMSEAWPAWGAAAVLRELQMCLDWILEASAVWRSSQRAVLGLCCASTDLQLIPARRHTSTVTHGPTETDCGLVWCTSSPVTVQSNTKALMYFITQRVMVNVTHLMLLCVKYWKHFHNCFTMISAFLLRTQQERCLETFTGEDFWLLEIFMHLHEENWGKLQFICFYSIINSK